MTLRLALLLLIASSAPAQRIRVGTGQMGDCGKLIYRVPAIYPKEARKKKIQGTVRLHATLKSSAAIPSLSQPLSRP